MPEKEKPKVLRRILSKENKKYCALCSSPELKETENIIYKKLNPLISNNVDYSREANAYCATINDRLAALKLEKIILSVSSISLETLLTHVKSHGKKRNKIHMFDKFNPGHDLRKRFIILNHFKGSPARLSPKIGDVVSVSLTDGVLEEGVIIQKNDSKFIKIYDFFSQVLRHSFKPNPKLIRARTTAMRSRGKPHWPPPSSSSRP